MGERERERKRWEQRENMWKTEQDDWNRRRIIMMKKKNDELDEGITKDNSGHNVDHGRGNDEDENSHRDGDENDKDNKPSPIEPNNKTNVEKYKNSTPTKQSQLSDSKDNTPLTTQNTLKNRTQLMLNKQGKPNNNTKIGEQGQDGTAPVLSNERVAKGSVDNDVDNDSFSACILWMDDNYRLEEWLAYHYYLMKLRYVVINIDPWSKTSPQSIIDRWNDAENKYNLNMTIVTMTDSEYVPDFDQKLKKLQQLENIALAQNNSTSAEASKYINNKTDYHRYRQATFYKACSHHLIEHNKSWTSYWDTDEFITFQQGKEKDREFGLYAEESTRKMEQPGYILRRLNTIKKEVNETGVSCVYVNRRRYCSKEMNVSRINQMFGARSVIPEGLVMTGSSSHSNRSNLLSINAKHEDRANTIRHLDTLRYNFLSPGMDGVPKSFIDLSQPHTKNFAGKWQIHRPMQALCYDAYRQRGDKAIRLLSEERFVINHYLGDWPSYSFRYDARRGGFRSYEQWSVRANMTQGKFTHVIWPWLAGFVELVGKGARGGPEVASYLLQDAGRFPEGFDPLANVKPYQKKA